MRYEHEHEEEIWEERKKAEKIGDICVTIYIVTITGLFVLVLLIGLILPFIKQ